MAVRVAINGFGRIGRNILRAIADKRVHHAWLITGPRGVGKATLAWRIARRGRRKRAAAAATAPAAPRRTPRARGG